MAPPEASMPSRPRAENVSRRRATGALALLASACSGQLIDLGENVSELDAAASRCRVTPRVAGPVIVESQDDLNELVGCEEIEGDLFVRPFEGPDFTPLAALRSVGGTLDIGRLTSAEQPNGDGEIERREIALVDAGWLRSLQGFESLERAGNLSLRGVSAKTLQAFSRLRQLSDGGGLEIGPCAGLRDLTGLEALTGLLHLQIVCNTLESLAGLSFPRSMGDVSLSGSSLVDLGDFDVEYASTLLIQSTALESLDALSGFLGAASISVTDNSRLVDMDGLGGVALVEELFVQRNPRLERLPDFVSVGRSSSLVIQDNAVLSNIPSFPRVLEELEGFSSFLELSPRDLLIFRTAIIEIIQNPGLEEVTMPAGWQAGGFVAIESNPALTRIGFSNMRAIDFLSVQDNAALAGVELGALATVNELRVARNPLLSLSEFDGLETFESVLSESDDK
jgi:hypothetical protein